MRFNPSPQESHYEVSSAEKSELTHWLDTVLANAGAEDVTGQIFIDNMVDQTKWLPAGKGLVNAYLRRVPYERARTVADLSDVVIDHDDILESNASQGIFFDVSDPAPGDYKTEYFLGLRYPGYEHPRYANLIYLDAKPPNEESGDYELGLDVCIKRGLDKDMRHDYVNFVIPEDRDIITATIGCLYADIVDGKLRHRPLDVVAHGYSGFPQHAQFIADVIGIPAPDFLRQN